MYFAPGRLRSYRRSEGQKLWAGFTDFALAMAISNINQCTHSPSCYLNGPPSGQISSPQAQQNGVELMQNGTVTDTSSMWARLRPRSNHYLKVTR